MPCIFLATNSSLFGIMRGSENVILDGYNERYGYWLGWIRTLGSLPGHVHFPAYVLESFKNVDWVGFAFLPLICAVRLICVYCFYLNIVETRILCVAFTVRLFFLQNIKNLSTKRRVYLSNCFRHLIETLKSAKKLIQLNI